MRRSSHGGGWGASVPVLMRRCLYGGRKGRSARRRLLARRLWIWTHPNGGCLAFTFKKSVPPIGIGEGK